MAKYLKIGWVVGSVFSIAFVGCEMPASSPSPEQGLEQKRPLDAQIQNCDSFPVSFTSDLIQNFQRGQPWPPIQHCLSFAKQEWKLALAPVGYDYIHLKGKSLKVSRGDATPNYSISGEWVKWGIDTLDLSFVREIGKDESTWIREYHQLIITSDTLFHYFFETDNRELNLESPSGWIPLAIKFAFPNALHAKPRNGMMVHYLGQSCSCAASFACEL